MQALSLESARFEGGQRTISGTRTESGNAMTVLFNDLAVRSGSADVDPAPQVLRVDGEVLCRGSGWVKVDLRGACLKQGDRAFAHVLAWANGRRLHLLPDGPDEPVCASTLLRIHTDSVLRLNLTLLAQRDIDELSSEALASVDSLDLLVVPPRSLKGRTEQSQEARS